MTATFATAGLAGTAPAFNLKSSTDTSSISATDTAGSQDRFLKLLVAQLNNQDPMNPMDNAQMTSQIAQINTVTGIQQLNETMKSMASQMSAMQMLQAGNLVGHSVLTEGSQLALDADKHEALGAIELTGAASSVKIQVIGAGGKVVDTVDLGGLSAGQHGFALDSSAWPAESPLQFKVVASNGAQAVSATTLMRDRVVAIGSGVDGLTLTLQTAGTLPYGSVRAVL
ncbi:MAG: flagellar hook capping FlgD N-terminal domain-containing protein [Burkholderiales bacterium]